MGGLSKALAIISHFYDPISNVANSPVRPSALVASEADKKDKWIVSSARRRSVSQRSGCPSLAA